MNTKLLALITTALALGASSAIARPAHFEQWKSQVESMDSNQDGSVSRAEAEAAAASHAQRIDSNGDGLISTAELQAERERRYLEFLQNKLDRADSNNDGQVQLDEFSSQMLERLMRLDRNKDGQIARRELHAKRGRGFRADHGE